MALIPSQILGIWLRGLLALAILGLGAYLVDRWYETPVVVVGPPSRDADGVEVRERRVERWRVDADGRTAALVAGLLLLATGLGGGRLVMPLLRKSGPDDPRANEGTDSARGGTEHELRRPDGSVLRVTTFGPDDAPTLVFTHGWGVNSAEWHYAKEHLRGRYRLILWDLPGLGRSTSPADRDWSLERLAGDLEAVLGLAGDRPAVLVGHSIGGMITLTFCRLFPEALASRVAGLVLVHTTPTNPVKTTGMATFYTAIQKPVLEPLCSLMIALAPLVWAMNWLAYLNGSQHRSTEKTGFSGHESRQQLDFAARFLPKAWPGVVARGMLAMFRYDASDVLNRITVPTLVVVGDRDNTTKPEAGAWIARDVHDARFAALSPAKHMGHLEHHDRFAEEVDRLASEALAASGRGVA